MKAWKRLEKEAAEAFGGIRRVRISYSERAGDIIHPLFSIECKWGKQIPKWVKDGPIIWGDCVIISLKDIKREAKGGIIRRTHRDRSCKFIADAMIQALSYDKTKKKIPLVAFKLPGMRGLIFCVRCYDYGVLKEYLGGRLLLQ